MRAEHDKKFPGRRGFPPKLSAGYDIHKVMTRMVREGEILYLEGITIKKINHVLRIEDYRDKLSEPLPRCKLCDLPFQPTVMNITQDFCTIFCRSAFHSLRHKMRKFHKKRESIDKDGKANE